MSIPKTLEERLRAGKVIPFVGAGVSMSVTDNETGEPLFPSWRELLLEAVKRLHDEQNTSHADMVRSFLNLNPPKYLEAAEYARAGLGEAIWYEFLKEQFDRPRERAKAESLNLAQAIWNLNSKLIITTNYDDVLRWALPANSHPTIWDREARAEMATFLRDGVKRPTIWYLHGHIHNASKIILTHDGYRRLYPEAKQEEGEEKYQAALKTLHSALTSHSLLFIGFSLNDAYFDMQLKGIHEIYEGANGPHYVLVHKDEMARVTSNHPVQAIPFDNFGAPMLKLVRELGSVTTNKEIDEAQPAHITETQPTRAADYDPRHPYFSVPFRQKGDQVIGREQALQDVRQQLTKGRRTSIGQAAAFQGLGGLGKTQLAVEYAYRFKDTYPNGVIWINADQDIDAQLTELAEKARWIAPKSEHKDKLEVARHRIRTYSDCLIIFDNLESAQAIESYLPEPQATPHILVTSRIDQPDFNPIPLDPLDDTLSFNLLLQEAGKNPLGEDEEKAAREIAQKLGGLPLALELSGAYLRHREVSWQQYRDLLSKNLKSALPGRIGSFTKHEADLYSTLKIHEEVLKEEPKLKDILDLLTWSGSAPMGQSLICALLNVKEPVELTNALGLGIALRMLQKTSNVDSYSIHRLVGEVRREEIPLQGREDWVNNICQRIGDWFEEHREEYNELFRFEAEIDHLQAWQDNAEHYAPSHSSRLIWLQAYPPYHQGHYREAKELVEKALELFQQEHEGDLKLKAHLLNDLGFCYGSLGDYKQQLKYTEKALNIRRELFGELYIDTATSLNNVAEAYGDLRDYKQRLEYQEKALNIYRELFGEHHADTAMSLDNMGLAYGDLGNYKQQLEYAERAFEIRRELFGERHPSTATSLNNVGLAHGNLGDYKQRLEYQEKAVDIYRELFGERHPSTVTSLNNVGLDYADLGEIEKAREYIERALQLRREILGDKHPDTIRSVNNLINVLISLDHRPEAFQLLKEFLTQLPKDHIHYDKLKKLEQHLLAKAVRPGFRQPPVNKKNRKVKKRKKKGH